MRLFKRELEKVRESRCHWREESSEEREQPVQRPWGHNWRNSKEASVVGEGQSVCHCRVFGLDSQEAGVTEEFE